MYNAYGEDGWNDELLVGDRVSEPEEQVERILTDAEFDAKLKKKRGRDNEGEGGEVGKKEEVQRPVPRVTEADLSGDKRSLNRCLERTLYLVVHGSRGQWTFPTAGLDRRESLHTVSDDDASHWASSAN